MTEREIIMTVLERLGRNIYCENSNSIEFENSNYGESIEIYFDENGNIIDICS